MLAPCQARRGAGPVSTYVAVLDEFAIRQPANSAAGFAAHAGAAAIADAAWRTSPAAAVVAFSTAASGTTSAAALPRRLACSRQRPQPQPILVSPRGAQLVGSPQARASGRRMLRAGPGARAESVPLSTASPAAAAEEPVAAVWSLLSGAVGGEADEADAGSSTDDEGEDKENVAPQLTPSTIASSDSPSSASFSSSPSSTQAVLRHGGLGLGPGRPPLQEVHRAYFGGPSTEGGLYSEDDLFVESAADDVEPRLWSEGLAEELERKIRQNEGGRYDFDIYVDPDCY